MPAHGCLGIDGMQRGGKDALDEAAAGVALQDGGRQCGSEHGEGKQSPGQATGWMQAGRSLAGLLTSFETG